MNKRIFELWIKTWNIPDFVFVTFVNEESRYSIFDTIDRTEVKEAILIERENNNKINMIDYRDYEKIYSKRR